MFLLICYLQQVIFLISLIEFFVKFWNLGDFNYENTVVTGNLSLVRTIYFLIMLFLLFGIQNKMYLKIYIQFVFSADPIF